CGSIHRSHLCSTATVAINSDTRYLFWQAPLITRAAQMILCHVCTTISLSSSPTFPSSTLSSISFRVRSHLRHCAPSPLTSVSFLRLPPRWVLTRCRTNPLLPHRIRDARRSSSSGGIKNASPHGPYRTLARRKLWLVLRLLGICRHRWLLRRNPNPNHHSFVLLLRNPSSITTDERKID
ncbi:hypothetical protein EX30DRAFT_385398, partial [Ascodesmis nigricans]